MWTTEIISKSISNGVLQVVVSFSDGTQTFTDKYETRNGQDANWLNDNIKRRIDDLTSVVAFADTITLGNYQIVEPVPTPEEPLEGKALYERKLKKFERMVAAIRKGATTDQNVNFINLKKWLKNNFDEQYLDLF